MTKFISNRSRSRWREVALRLKDTPREQLPHLVERVSPADRDYYIFAGAAFSEVNGSDYKVFQQMIEDKLSIDRIIELYLDWATNYDSDMHSKYHYWLERLPGFRHPIFSQEIYRAALISVVQDSPDESVAYIEAARRLVGLPKTSTAIAEFRTMWPKLSPERREAIAIELQPKPHELLNHGPDNRVVVIQHMTSPLESLLGDSHESLRILNRARWIDAHFPLLRGEAWETFSIALREFSAEANKLGGEREQVGAMLQAIMTAFRSRNGHRFVKGNRGSTISVDRYVFSASEENDWGADFALVFLFDDEERMSICRYILFQAKLLKGGAIRIPTGQLENLLRASWHSSYYIVWKPGHPVECLSAALLKNALLHDRLSKGIVANPSLSWSKVSAYADSMVDLLVDRYLCGEIGDPLEMESGTDNSEVATRLATMFGPFRHGVIIVRAAVGKKTDGDREAFRVGIEDNVINTHGKE